MMNNDTTFSNPPVVLVEKEFEETSLDVNFSQWSHEEKPFKRIVRTWIDRSKWDRQLSPNPHALVIYLEFVHVCGATLKKFEKC